MRPDLPDVFDFTCPRRFLAARRVAMGLSIREVSRRAGIRGETWAQQVESGKRRLVEPNLGRLARLLGLDPEEERFLGLLAQREELAPGPLREELDRRILAAKAARLAGGWGAGVEVGILRLRSEVETPPEPWERARAAQRRAEAVLRALQDPPRPAARFLGISQATSAAGFALAERALDELAEQLHAGSTAAEGPPTHLVQLELFPLTRTLSGEGPPPSGGPIPSVQEHSRASAFLLAWLDAQRLTMAWLAQRLGVARSTVTRALSQRRIGPQLEELVCAMMMDEGEFSPEDAALFRLLAAREQAPAELRDALSEAIATLRVQTARRESEDYSEEVLGDWRCAAVVDLPLLLPLRPEDVETIGAALDPPIPPEEARAVVEKLVRARMLRCSKGGLLQAQPYPVWLRRRVERGGVEGAFLANLRAMQAEGARRLEALSRGSGPSGARFWTLALWGDARTVETRMVMLEAGQQRLACLLGDPAERPDRVAQVNLQLFPAA